MVIQLATALSMYTLASAQEEAKNPPTDANAANAPSTPSPNIDFQSERYPPFLTQSGGLSIGYVGLWSGRYGWANGFSLTYRHLLSFTPWDKDGWSGFAVGGFLNAMRIWSNFLPDGQNETLSLWVLTGGIEPGWTFLFRKGAMLRPFIQLGFSGTLESDGTNKTDLFLGPGLSASYGCNAGRVRREIVGGSLRGVFYTGTPIGFEGSVFVNLLALKGCRDGRRVVPPPTDYLPE